ncbi:MAG: hypothetical protein ACKVOO_01775 [Burkholderiaceae bacterium]
MRIVQLASQQPQLAQTKKRRHIARLLQVRRMRHLRGLMHRAQTQGLLNLVFQGAEDGGGHGE